ncbi:MAG: hypothetical protein EAZ77_09560 [Nostocales cyanobacterium]|nr:MAG: hypothetical protein EAZ77_09560 [Nostocales cyanobacterium]
MVLGLFNVDNLQEISVDTIKTQALFQVLDDSSFCPPFYLLTPTLWLTPRCAITKKLFQQVLNHTADFALIKYKLES